VQGVPDDDDHQGPRGFGFSLPPELVQHLVHDREHARAEDRYLATMRWLESLDVDGLMALRYVLMADPESAYGNACRYDGMAIQLLRAKGVDPRTGTDPAAALLERGEAGAEG